MFKADAETAFLQGSLEDQELHFEPVAELSQALGLQHHQRVQLRRSLHGPTNAPPAWWGRVGKGGRGVWGAEDLENRTVFLGQNFV